MTDSQETEQGGLNPTAQALSQIFKKTIEVDPRRLVREFELDLARKVLKQTQESIERDKSDKEDMSKELIAEAKRQVAEKEKTLEQYEPDIARRKSPTSITIGYVPESILTEYDLGEQIALVLEIGSRERNEAFYKLDRLLVRHGVKGHKGVAFKDVEIPFSFTPYDGPSRVALEVVDLYSRAKWLRSLRWAIYRYNTLAEEKKSR